MNRHPILYDTQRQAITTAHFDLDEREIERYWTLSEHDLVRINRELAASLRKENGLTYFWEESAARMRRTEVRPT